MRAIPIDSADFGPVKMLTRAGWGRKIAAFLLMGLLLCPMPLRAGGKGSKYPLRIQIQKASYRSTNLGSMTISATQLNRETIDPGKYYFGRGSGSLFVSANESLPFSFTYEGCIDPVPITNGVSLAARWKKQDRTMEVRVPAFSPEKPVKFSIRRMSNCRVDFSFQPIVSGGQGGGPVR